MNAQEFIARKIYSEASGVTAIVEKHIHLQLNEYGLYEEVINPSTIQELDPLVEYVSPSFNTEINESIVARKLYGNILGIQHDERIGYYLSLYAGHVTEGDYREQGSSGGMGTWIFKELFTQGLIDGVIHVKSNPDKNSPVLFHYGISRTLDDIRAGAKTKYYPVELSEVLKIVKTTPGRYAVIGIPSFIMSIRLLSEKDDVFRERIKYTVGLICGHQKSSKFAEALAWQVGIKPGNLKHIDFRKKLPDCPASQYAVEMTGLIDGQEVTIVRPKSEFLGQDWGQGFFKATASDFTDDVMNETADITLGDAWLPQYTKDSEGNNVVLVRNPEIDCIIKEGVKTGSLQMDIIDEETLMRSQAAHFRHTRDELAYRLYKKDKKKQWRPQKRVQASNKIPLMRRKVQDLREEIFTQSHILYKKAIEMDDLSYFMEKMGKLSKRYQNLYRLMSIKNIGLKRILKAIKHKVIMKV